MSQDVPLEEVVLFQLERTTKKAKKSGQSSFADLGIDVTVEQWVLLKIIEQNQPLTQKELSELSYRDPASINRTLVILEKRGFVLKEKSSKGRRDHALCLTNNGVMFIKQHMSSITMLRQNSLKGLSKGEIALLLDMLQRIQSNFK